MTEPTIIDSQKIDAIITKNGTLEGALIPILQDVQAECGYLPKEVMEYILTKTEIKPTELYGVATFYTQFRFTPVGKFLIKVCHGTACHVRNAGAISKAICDELNIKDKETSKDRLFTLETVACLGCCSLAPVIMINDKVYGKLTPDSTKKILRDYKNGEVK